MEERLMEEEGDIEMQIESDEEDDSQVASHLESGLKLSQMENRVGIQMKNVSSYSQPVGAKRDNTQVQDMDEASSDEDTPVAKLQPTVAPMLPPTHDKVVVKKYDPKATQPKAAPLPTDEYLISPITGEKIPASKVSEHMRIGLLDPRWVEQRDKHTVEKINQDNVFAAGTAIEASLKQLAERRTDIFGVGDEETVIGKKLGEEETKKDDRVTWDGHTSSVEAATRAARANITLEDQIHQIHKVKGLLPDEEKEKIGPKPVGNKATLSAPPQPSSKPQHIHGQSQHHQGGGHHAHHNLHHHHPPQQHQSTPQHQTHQHPSHHHQQSQAQANPVMMMQLRPLMMQTPFGPGTGGYMNMQSTGGPPQISPAPPVDLMSVEEEPPTKKLRSEDNLIPEAEFISTHKSPVTIQVLVPNSDKSEWKLNGQMIAVTLALTDPIANLKAKLQDETGMPPAKQKIFYEGMFFKDSNSMAFYNLLNGMTVHLQVKERGGRKK
ncbi:GL22994 [Drosophila persimilis]|nr:GL22994 [Drosophila persimilis]